PDHLRQQDDRIVRVRPKEALLLLPEALERDVAVPSPLILEQLHGMVHAIKPTAVVDRGEERFHVQSPESWIESSSLLRKRWTRRIFQPVRSAISGLE